MADKLPPRANHFISSKLGAELEASIIRQQLFNQIYDALAMMNPGILHYRGDF